MAGKKSNCYFDAYIELAECTRKEAVLLNDYINQFDLNQMDVMLTKMHELETSADRMKHEMMDRLAKEFITPIEREDIYQLFNEIESVSDAIEDILIKMHIFCISTIREEAKQFAAILLKSCDVLKQMMIEFPNFKKSEKLHDYIVEINDLEEEGDRLYASSIHGMFSTSGDPIDLMRWTETLDRFEKSCDAIEHVAIVVESVVMNNI